MQSQAITPSQSPTPGHNLGIASIPNMRDVGGFRTQDGGTVARGHAYRSSQLNNISPEDMQKLADLKIRNVYDLRTEDERKKRPEELPPAVNYVVLDVLADSPQAGPAMLEKLLEDPKAANSHLGGGKIEAAFRQSYREFVSLPSARRGFRSLFLALGDKEQIPALFHCTTGKDRTGWAAAALLSLLGVPKDRIIEDYLRSNNYILPVYQKVIRSFVAAGGDEEIPLAILGVRREYIDASFDEMQNKYGSIDN